jgi:CheY-like chemotaxis protein
MKKEILVIDDNKPMRYVIQTLFRKHYKVTAVPTGLAAMNFLRQGHLPSLIIVSAELDDMANWELVKHLSLSPLYNDIPMIVISSEDEATVKANVMKYNAAEYFAKPFNPLRLIESVDTILLGSPIHKI